MKSKKNGFWLLAIVFLAWAAAVWGMQVLTYTMAPSQGHHSSMMGASMSGMMRQHVQIPSSLGELLTASEENENMQGSGQNHHASSGIMGIVHNLTSLIIYLVCPFLVGGTVFLLINWIFLTLG